MSGKRYIYTGNAAGASASVTRIDEEDGLDHVVPTVGHSYLPVTGGRSHSKREHFCFMVEKPRKLTILSVKTVETHVTGKPDNGGFVTVADVSMQGFSLLEQVTVDHLEAHMESVHTGNSPFPAIRTFDADMQGLKIEGHELIVEFDEDVFSKFPLKSDLVKEFGSNRSFRDQFGPRLGAAAGAAAIPEVNGYCLSTIVTSVRWADPDNPHPGVTIKGNTLQWDDFGTLYLGELVISDGLRRLTMIRGQMGSPVDGSGSGGEIGANGSIGP